MSKKHIGCILNLFQKPGSMICVRAPNNMSQSAKSANYTHTSIRIGKTEKLDKDYVL